MEGTKGTPVPAGACSQLGCNASSYQRVIACNIASHAFSAFLHWI